MSWAEDEGFDSYDWDEIEAHIEAMRARRKIPYIATIDDFEDLIKEPTSPGEIPGVLKRGCITFSAKQIPDN